MIRNWILEKISSEWKNIEAEKEVLRKREEEIRLAEIKRDGGFSDEVRSFKETMEERRKEKEKELLEYENSERERIAALIKEVFEKQKEDVQNTLNAIRDTAKADLAQELSRQKDEYEKFFEEQKQIAEKYKKDIYSEIEKARTYFNNQLSREKSVFDNQIMEERKNCDNSISSQRTEFDSYKDSEHKKLNERQANLDKFKDTLDLKECKIERKNEELEEKESRINDEIEDKTRERKNEYEKETSRLREEHQRLLDSIEATQKYIYMFEELKSKLGGEDPAVVLKQLKEHEENLNSLRQELSERPSREIEERFNEFKTENECLKRRKEELDQDIEKMKANVDKNDSLLRENEKLNMDNQMLVDAKANLQAHNNELQAELDRLQASYKNKVGWEERVESIKKPYLGFHEDAETGPRKIERKKANLDENEWLADIRKKIKDAEFKIPRRILYAFHTALKTAEWSPITVLAGVSGTGKSELPRLYSLFGGINFLSLPVQPNWDSQESMLGFFNSIDNKFDAQPVLRLLAQSQEEPREEYPYGLKDTMNIILLDEMNLAHIEQYFAEFLSKLELRRGCVKDELPTLPVKLGAGIDPFNLNIGRNVLWVGTMNQDETTKSLSDKVLDRGIIINFPRPTKLQSRTKLQQLKQQPNELLLSKTWSKWTKRETTLNEEETNKYKEIIETMNGYLANAGRALGHRVWQSIELYMSNYPIIDGKSREDMLREAFEDQLVQKVMPKLRGIETRERSNSRTECLDKIKKQLEENGHKNLVNDFDFACKFGDGQFNWNSAYYLGEDE